MPHAGSAYQRSRSTRPASDDGTYVLKFRGAGQGVKVLVAEIIVAELARLIDVPVPRLALVTLDPLIAKYEADEEVQDLLTASLGLNLGIDFLPGSFGYDGSHPPPGDQDTRPIDRLFGPPAGPRRTRLAPVGTRRGTGPVRPTQSQPGTARSLDATPAGRPRCRVRRPAGA